MVDASIPDAFGISAELISRSGAGSGVTESYPAAYYNPAALALPSENSQLIRHQLGAGFLMQKPDMAVNTIQGSALARNNAAIGSDIDAYGVQVFGAIFDVRSLVHTPYRVPVKLGVVFAAPAPEIGRITETSQQFYTFQQIGRQSAIPNAALSLGFQAWRNRLSIGGGVQFSATMNARIALSDLTTDGAVPPTSDSELEVKLRPSAIAGITYRQPLPGNFEYVGGFTFRPENQVSVSADVFATLPISGLGVVHYTYLRLAGYYRPRTYQLSQALHWKSWGFYADVEYQQWSKFQLSESRRLFETPPGFYDIVILRVGTDWKSPFWKLVGRAGYALIPAMTPDQTGSANYLANNRHNFSFGLGRSFSNLPRLKADLTIDIAFQWQYWQPRTTNKEIRSALSDGTTQPDYNYGGNLFIGSLSLTLKI